MLNLFFATLSTLLLSASAFAGGPGCTTVKDCAKVVTDLTGEIYIWDDTAEPAKFHSSQDLVFTKENSGLLFTTLLDQAGFARMPIGDGHTYRIVRTTTLKELTTPVLEASAEHFPDFPKTWDWVTMRYKLKNPGSVAAIEQSYRLHVPRDSRMQADLNAGTMIVTGPTPMVSHMYEMIKGADRPLSPASKAWDKRMNEPKDKK